MLPLEKQELAGQPMTRAIGELVSGNATALQPRPSACGETVPC